MKCKVLHLQNNEISELPKSIGDLKCNFLNLFNNNIKELPKSIGNLKCNHLFLNNNKIDKNGIKYLDHIKGLKYCSTDYSHNLDVIFKLCKINSRKEKVKSLLD